ncbi:electron transport complex subunit RsxB [Piscinibacterium candidicorallinum]|uniref:Electron transport complex subunit RsxB n=1 Tax=Piscinibacterium candidicorallinum TaxID=1793872 RepID=A0ABV7GZX6_9BURK
MRALADQIHDVLPMTQCTKCGYTGCRPYAEAIAAGQAQINQCPPGGAAGIEKLAAVTGFPVLPLNPANGVEGPRRIAVIDEARCIGCTLCIQACPVDAIVGAPKWMHGVIDALCTGCDLCVAPCPVDCISMEEKPGLTGWTDHDAAQALHRYESRNARLIRERAENDERLAAKAQDKLAHLAELTKTEGVADPAAELARKRSAIEAALARARERRQAGGTGAKA